MLLKISAEMESQEVLDFFYSKLKESGVDPESGKFYLKIQNKSGEWVDLTPEKVKVVFTKE